MLNSYDQSLSATPSASNTQVGTRSQTEVKPILQSFHSYTPQPELDKISDLFQNLGLVGCSHLAMLVFLVMVSCRRSRPLSLLLAGSSATGKSHVVKTIGSYLIPKEWLMDTGRISPAVLTKFPDGFFVNRIIFLEESAGKANEAALALRLLQSEGVFRRWVTEKGQAKIEEIKGPVALIETTSDDTSLFCEDNLTRFLIARMDESTEQTRKILEQQAFEAENGMHKTACIKRRWMKVLR